MRRKTCIFGAGLVGLFLLLVGAGFACFGTRNLIRMWAWEKLTLKNNSEAMMKWMRPPLPLSMKVYLFNVTNADAVSEGAFPILSEVGPYVYEQVREKVNVVQLDNYTLSYQVQNIIRFKPHLSGGLKETDLVTILNVPLVGAILTVYETVPEFIGLLDNIWTLLYPGQSNIFITTSVKEILFDGITIDCTSKVTEVFVACRGLESRKSYSVRKEGKNFKFSFFHAKNGTSSETYQVNQGITNLMESAQYIGMNYSPSVKVWKNEYCDMINGSDGAQFSVLLNKTQRLYIFEKEICRSVYLKFEEELVINGVTLYKFSNTDSLFASPEKNPDNLCFCRSPLSLKDLVGDENEDDNDDENSQQDRKQICFKNGILPLMPCVGAPVVVSFPHFYLGDESYLNYSGLTPIKDLHETFIYVEPLSGVSVMGFKRIQFNLEVKRVADLQITSNVVDGLFPILWVEEGMQLSPDLFKLLKYSLLEKKILEVGTYVLIALGLVLITIASVAHFLMRKSAFRKGTDNEVIAKQNRQSKEREARARLGIWQNSNRSVFPIGSVDLNFTQ